MNSIQLYDGIEQSFYIVSIGFLAYRLEMVWKPFSILLGIVFFLKYVVQKERPDHSDKESFPSGHSAIAWLIVYVYDWHPLIFVWAVLVSSSRVVHRKHDIVDVISGGCLGILVPYLTL